MTSPPAASTAVRLHPAQRALQGRTLRPPAGRDVQAAVTTALQPGTDLQPLAGIPVISIPSEHNTTFENITDSGVRRQILPPLFCLRLTVRVCPRAFRCNQRARIAMGAAGKGENAYRQECNTIFLHHLHVLK